MCPADIAVLSSMGWILLLARMVALFAVTLKCVCLEESGLAGTVKSED